MAIPVSYNLRNLAVRKGTTLMTALGVALTVAVLLTTMALVAGLDSLFASSGNPLNVLVMRKGSTAELSSNFSRETFQEIRFKNAIARSKSGRPMVSLELVTVVNLPSVDNPDGSNVTLRGLSLEGIELRDNLKLESGRWFQPGRTELVVGKSLARRFPDARLGNKIRLARGTWEVVGVMDAGVSAANSEIFADLNQMAAVPWPAAPKKSAPCACSDSPASASSPASCSKACCCRCWAGFWGSSSSYRSTDSPPESVPPPRSARWPSTSA
jgi:putative ABC transport system permease protein